LSRSSIFSFDTLREFPVPTKAACVALAVCLSVRLLMAWRMDLLEQVPAESLDSGTIKAEAHLKQSVREPRVLVVGSSLTEAGLVPEHLASELGMSTSEVGEYAIGGGTPWDILVFFRRNPELLQSVQLVVMDIGPWQMDEHVWDFIRNRFLWHATLRERWQATGWRKAAPLADWFWPVLTQRRELRSWVLGIQALARPSPQLEEPEENLYWSAFASAKGRQTASNHPDFAPVAAAQGLTRMSWSAPMEQRLRELLRILHDHEVPLLLHQSPRHPDYFAWIDQHPEAKEKYQDYVRFAHSLAGPTIRVQIWEKPKEVGLKTEDFLDYGHLGRPGAEIYTRALGKLIKGERLCAKPQAAQVAPFPTTGQTP
jgi:hypothetical protein